MNSRPRVTRAGLRLPVLPGHSTAESGGCNADAVPSPPLGGYRLLLVDDNRDFVDSLALILRALGHEVRVANDGQDAFAMAGLFTPDFAFLDIGLPGLDGYALAKRLRALPAWRNTVLVAVTGWGQEADRRRAREAGFDHHLVKPVELDNIRTILGTPRATG